MSTSAPGPTSVRPAKAAGAPAQSTCPAMTAGPVSPGTGPPVYQPATAGSAGGTSAPAGSSPTPVSGTSTPAAGTRTRTGALGCPPAGSRTTGPLTGRVVAWALFPGTVRPTVSARPVTARR